MVRHIDDYASEMFQCPLVIDLTVISLGILVYISGYLLTVTDTSFNSFTDIKRFLIKRILRIYPLYALALLIFYFLSIINGKKFISGLLMYNLYAGEYILTLWFIPMIMAFYLVYVLVNYKYNVINFLSIAILIFVLLIIERLVFRQFDSVLILYFPSFIIGILSGKYPTYIKISADKAYFMLGIITILLLLSTNGMLWDKLSILVYNVMISIIAFISMNYLDKKRINKNIMTQIKRISYASFCMYLIHRAIFSISLSVYKPSSDILTLVYLYVVAIPLICILSFYLQKYYDQLVNAQLAYIEK
jgi:peptidoglycan/LPS O-acetylase OafA/YrhL